MSQLQARKPASGYDGGPRARTSFVKASGDSAPGNTKLNPKPRSNSKNKIPKSIRYDLENALVGLCNVWFEEIKPHLLRNNIKVHTHGAAGAAGPAAGDHQRWPPGAPVCSHLDPGAAPNLYLPPNVDYADCCSTEPTASRVRYHRPQMPLLPPPVPPLALAKFIDQNPSQVCEKVSHRRKRCSAPQQPQHPQPINSRAPYISRIQPTTLPRATLGVPKTIIQTAKYVLENGTDVLQLRGTERFRQLRRNLTLGVSDKMPPKPAMKNKSTQTRTCVSSYKLDNDDNMMPIFGQCPGIRFPISPRKEKRLHSLSKRGPLHNMAITKTDQHLKILYRSPTLEAGEYPSSVILMPSVESLSKVAGAHRGTRWR